MIEESVIEIFTTQVGISSSSLDGENTSGNRQKGDIEGTSTEIEDEDVTFRLGLGGGGVETVGDGGGGRLVDDTEYVETGNGTSVLGGETLRVVEVRGDTAVDRIFLAFPPPGDGSR